MKFEKRRLARKPSSARVVNRQSGATPGLVANMNHRSGRGFIRSAVVEAAVVMIVSVVVPLPVTTAGRKVQMLSEGRPEHEAGVKLTLPA